MAPGTRSASTTTVVSRLDATGSMAARKAVVWPELWRSSDSTSRRRSGSPAQAVCEKGGAIGRGQIECGVKDGFDLL